MLKALRGALVFAVVSSAAVVSGAEFELHPSIAVSEEFTDNVFETNTNRTSDYITRTLPGVAMSYKVPAVTWNIDYVFDYRFYARKNRDDEVAHSLNAKGHLIAVENFLFLDISDEFKRVSLDATMDVTKESLFVNQADRNVATASPYLTLHPTARIAVKPGYRFIDTRYFSTSGIDKIDHIAFLEIRYELMKRWSLTADYNFTREFADIGNFSQHHALGGFRCEYSEKSFIFAQAGNSWTHFDNDRRIESVVWNAGITHVFDTATATVATGVRYNEDPLRNTVKESFVGGAIEQRLVRGSFSFSPQYSEYVATRTDTLQTKKYGATARAKYDLYTDLNGNLGFTAEKFEQPFFGSYTRRFQVDFGLSYLLGKQLTASLFYLYADYFSPKIAADNRFVNRAIIEIKKTF